MYKKFFLICFFIIFFSPFFYAQDSQDQDTVILEDFEDQNLWSPITTLGWWNLDSVYNYIISDQVFFDGKYSMKVEYNKTKAYQLFAAYLDSTNPKKDFSKYDTISLMVYGSAKILLKLEDRFSKQYNLGIKTSLDTEGWNRLDFEFSHINIDKANIKNIFLFFAPGDVDVRGKVFIDHIFLTQKQDPKKFLKQVIEGFSQETSQETKEESQENSSKEINLANPYSFVFDQDQNIYVIEQEASIILKYNKYGTYVSEIGRLGSKTGELAQPLRICALPNNQGLYVLEEKNKRVQKFNLDGKIDSSFASQGALIYKNEAKDMAIDSQNNIYILEKDAPQISCYNAKGEFLKIIQIPLALPKKIKCIEDHLYLFDEIGIHEFDLDGNFLKIIKYIGPSEKEIILNDIAINPMDGSCFVITEEDPNFLLIFDKNGTYIGQSNFFDLKRPSCIEIILNEQGKPVIYVADIYKMKIYSCDLSEVKGKII